MENTRITAFHFRLWWCNNKGPFCDTDVATRDTCLAYPYTQTQFDESRLGKPKCRILFWGRGPVHTPFTRRYWWALWHTPFRWVIKVERCCTRRGSNSQPLKVIIYINAKSGQTVMLGYKTWGQHDDRQRKGCLSRDTPMIRWEGKRMTDNARGAWVEIHQWFVAFFAFVFAFLAKLCNF